MDKYEYNVKSDQIKKLYNRKEYDAAAKLADEIDWRKVKDNSMISRAADVYENAKQYEKAKDVLLVAYERSPLGRQLAYRLTVLSLRTKDFVEADEFYHDFVEMSPNDVTQYILKYRIAKAKGEDSDVLISILEAYVDVEMDERWQYELAKLYEEAGQIDKCMDMCDEIILWFNDGKYVDRALQLKKKHSSLTASQEQKLELNDDEPNINIENSEKECDIADLSDVHNSVPEVKSIDKNVEENLNNTLQNIVLKGYKNKDTSVNPAKKKVTGNTLVNLMEGLDKAFPLDSNLVNSFDEDSESFEDEESVEDKNIEEILDDTSDNNVSDMEIKEEPVETDQTNVDIEEISDEITEPEENQHLLDDQEEPADDENVEIEQDESELEQEKMEDESGEMNEIDNNNEALKAIREAERAATEARKAAEVANRLAIEAQKKAIAAQKAALGNSAPDTDKYSTIDSLLDDNNEEVEEDDDYLSDYEEENVKPEVETDDPQDRDSVIEIYEFDEKKDGKCSHIGDELTKTAEIDISEINYRLSESTNSIYDTANIQAALAESMKKLMNAENVGKESVRNAFEEKEDKEDDYLDDKSDEPTKRIDREELNRILNSSKKSTVEVKEQIDTADSQEKEEPVGLSNAMTVEEQIEGQMTIEEVLAEFDKRKEAEDTDKGNDEEVQEQAETQISFEENVDLEEVDEKEEVPEELGEEIDEQSDEESDVEQDEESEEIDEHQDLVQALTEHGELDDEADEETEEVDESSYDQDASESKETENVEISQKDIDESPNNEIGKEPVKEVVINDIDKEALKNHKIPIEFAELFGDFLTFKGMDIKIADTLNNLVNNFVMDGTSKQNNIIITGGSKVGKSALGLSLIKAANRGRGRSGRKVAKVKATALNKRGVATAMMQILGTDLIIEQAGNLMPNTLIDLMAVMKAYTEEMIVILEDDKAAIDRMLSTMPDLANMFNNRLDIVEFEIDDLVKVAKSYAKREHYEIDDIGTLALYAKIDDISGRNQGITFDEIEEIIEDAIDHASRLTIGRLFGKLRKNKNDMDVLTEDDFL